MNLLDETPCFKVSPGLLSGMASGNFILHMHDKTFLQALLCAFSNACPACESGKVFSGLMKMNPTCPSCGIVFERESGYFVGAMSLSYFLAFLAVLPVFLPLLLSDYPLWVIVGIPSLEAILISPLIFRYSRLVWIHLDRRFGA